MHRRVARQLGVEGHADLILIPHPDGAAVQGGENLRPLPTRMIPGARMKTSG